MAIEWNPETMRTGSSQTDEEHREWLRRFNQFEASLVNRRGMEEISRSLQNFAEYSDVHFPHEEALMDRVNSPYATLNRAEHDRFREKLQQIQTALHVKTTNLAEVLRLKNDLEFWLVSHICQVDTQLRLAFPDEPVPTPPTLGDYMRQAHASFPANFVETILQTSPDAIIIIDPQGRIVFAGGRCADLLGYQPEELVGQSVEMLVLPQHQHKHETLRDKYRTRPTPRTMGKRPVLSLQHKSGARIPVDIALSPLPEVAGMRGLVQAVIRDAMPRWNTQMDLLVQSVAMNAAANGIVLTDTKGVIQWVNPAVTLMTGYTARELIGKTPSLFKSGQHDPDFYKELWKTVMTGKTWFGEIVNRRKDGSLYYEEQHIAPVRNEDGEITRLIAIKQDVTARRLAEIKLQEANRQLQDHVGEIQRLADLLGEYNRVLEDRVTERTAELKRANQQLQELDDLKSAFLGVISHELRTPFVSLTMAAQLFKGYGLENLQPQQVELFRDLDDNIQAARTMVENLVSYAAFVRKQGELRLADVDLKQVIDLALLAFKFQADRKKQSLVTDLPSGLPGVRGDSERLVDAISQLVDNAVKFTPEGGRVLVRAWQEHDWLVLAVEDNGPGIPPEKLSTLWESFAQMADPLRRGREGLGLGLALVEYIIRAHHGEIWAESQPGHGSKFGFRLPII